MISVNFSCSSSETKRQESMAPNFLGGRNSFENVVKAKNPFLEKAGKKYFTYTFKDILQDKNILFYSQSYF